MPIPYVIEPARESDTDILRDSWRKSYRLSPRTAKWCDEPYAIFISDLMDRLLARSRVVVARPTDWSEGVLGWVAAEQQPTQIVVHYAYVLDAHRKQGLMKALIASLEPKGKLVFSSLRPPFSAALQKLGFVFDRHAASNRK